ncbi:MAG TPA: hypothetical protein VNP96_12145 [Solirubrobacterales bacterium]|nr:hypothetical protein [Solirubrobacterales bacterium]
MAGVDQSVEGVVHGGEVSETVKAIGALLQLTRGLRAAQHQDGEQRELGLVETEGVVEQVAVLAGSAAGAAGEARPAAQGEPPQRLDHGRLVVLDDRIAVGRLVAGQPQRVER